MKYGTLVVTSGVLETGRLKQVIDRADSAVILKMYRNYREILDMANDLDLTEGSVLVSR